MVLKVIMLKKINDKTLKLETYFFALLLMSEATVFTHFALRRQPYPKYSDCFSMSIREKLYINDTLIMSNICLTFV